MKRLRTILFCCFTLLTLLSAALWIFAHFYQIVYRHEDFHNEKMNFSFIVYRDALFIHRGLEFAIPGLRVFPQSSSGNTYWIYFHSVTVPRFGSMVTDWRIGIPYWMLFVASLLPAALLWRSRPRSLPFRRRPNPLACQKCGYNLTANISGTCPECGTPIPAATPM